MLELLAELVAQVLPSAAAESVGAVAAAAAMAGLSYRSSIEADGIRQTETS